jgi:hypothetical protein
LGKTFCPLEASCSDYFFPESDRQSLKSAYRTDVRAECQQTEKTCGGGGNLSCFKSMYATVRQRPFCPFPVGAKQKSFSYAPGPDFRSRNSTVLYTGEYRAVAAEIMSLMYPSGTEARPAMSRMLSDTVDWLYSALLGIPLMGCADTVLDSQLRKQEEEAVCALLQSGSGSNTTCCIDVSDDVSLTGLVQGTFTGNLTLGKHYWSDSEAHSQQAYWILLSQTLAQLGGNQGQANRLIAAKWYSEGAVFATGVGKRVLLGKASALLRNAGVDIGGLRSIYASARPHIDCARPRLLPNASAALARDANNKTRGCVPLQEGLAILAKVMGMKDSVHPDPEPNRTIPDCTYTGNCTFAGIPGLFVPSGGRWAQVCDYHIGKLESNLADIVGDIAALAQLEKMPCMCKFVFLAKTISANLLFPSGIVAGILSRIPLQFGCAEGGSCGAPAAAAPGGMTPFNMEQMPLVTTIWPAQALYVDSATSVNNGHWWNWEKRTEPPPPPSNETQETCRQSRTCWKDEGRGAGRFSVLSTNCSAIPQEYCLLRRLANLSSVTVGCYEATSGYMSSQDEMDARLYEGQFDKSVFNDTQEEFLQGFNFHATSRDGLHVTVLYNDTSVASGYNPGDFGIMPRLVRINDPVRLAIDAYITWRQGGQRGNYSAAMVGLKEMPKPASIVSLDFGSLIGPFLFTLVFYLLLPVMIVSLVYEKEIRLRVLMQMLGLGTLAYWSINYFFWLCIYIMFSLVFYIFGSLVRLPSGYSVAIITKNEPTIHVVFCLLFINNTIASACLAATLFRKSRTAQVSSTMWVIGMALIAWAAWDVRSGNLFNVDYVSVHVKNVITMVPLWGYFRGWMEFNEYSNLAVSKGGYGMTWNDVATDPRNGMSAVFLFLGLEWPVFVLLALYFDQVLDNGRGVPQHPLFFLGVSNTVSEAEEDDVPVHVKVEGDGAGNNGINKPQLGGEAGDGQQGSLKKSASELAVTSGKSTEYIDQDQDVTAEEARVYQLLTNPQAMSKEAVIMNRLRKVYMGSGGRHKIAVRGLSMAVAHGEVFGMLGPNGAGAIY